MNNHKFCILVIDDDTRILQLLQQFLIKNDFHVYTALNVDEAKKLLIIHNFDLIILDVMLPNITGLEFSRIIRSANNSIPIVMLTALSEASDRINGLEAGASDYVTKPFEPQELLLRINNLIKNKEKNHNINQKFNIQYFGINSYDFKKKEFKKKLETVELSSTEEKLLEFLLKNSGKIISREELAQLMGGISLRSIDVKITRLRSKVEENPKKPKYLRTIRNVGYAIYT